MRQALKTIRSHRGYARFLGELEHEGDDLLVVREVLMPTDIPSPYSYSQTWPVYRWNGREVLVRETAHRCYQVFALNPLERALGEHELRIASLRDTMATCSCGGWSFTTTASDEDSDRYLRSRVMEEHALHIGRAVRRASA